MPKQPLLTPQLATFIASEKIRTGLSEADCVRSIILHSREYAAFEKQQAAAVALNARAEAAAATAAARENAREAARGARAKAARRYCEHGNLRGHNCLACYHSREARCDHGNRIGEPCGLCQDKYGNLEPHE